MGSMTQEILCQDEELFNPLLSMGLQAALILSVSHFIQLLLKPSGQPTPIAQLMAGTLIGHSVLSEVPIIESYFFQKSSADYYEVMAFFSRIFIVFLIGLELDLSFTWRSLRATSTVVYTGILLSFIFAGGISKQYFQYFAKSDDPGAKDHYPAFVLLMMTLMANSASPIVVRFTSDLNIGSSQFGRFAVCCSVVNDVTCLFLGAIARRSGDPGYKIGGWIGGCFVAGMFSVLMRYLVHRLNGWNRNHKYLKNAQFIVVFLVIIFSAGLMEIMGENSILTSFMLGVTFPRAGKTTRTLRSKLSYAIYTFVLPVYLGYTGFQVDLKVLVASLNKFLGVVVFVTLSTGAKMIGTLAACLKLKIPMKKGVVLALLLNVKGHYDVLILGRVKQSSGWKDELYHIMLLTIILNTLISGISAALIVRGSPTVFGYNPIALEFRSPEKELRILSCVHGPRHVPSMTRLIGALSWSRLLPVTAYLLHLVELPPVVRRKRNKMYNQLEEDELSDDETYGGNDALEISDSVDAFVAETGIFIHLLKAVAPMAKIYEEVCEEATEVRSSVIILPFHKHQRIDGKMESGKEGLRATNQKVLRNAPCTVAILIDRGILGRPQVPGLQTMQHVAVLFFGGSDDREALSFSKRIGMQVQVNMTVIRFLRRENSSERINISSQEDSEVLMAMPSRGTEDEADNAFLEEFYNRYVTSGQVGYVEKHVKNGAETAMALREVADMYELFIVGKGGRQNAPMTTGMSDWEEFPELGTVGDLLASSDFESNSSVLIVQQHKPTTD